jgi:hypothetical protein
LRGGAFSSAHPGVGNPRGRHVVDVVRVVDPTTWKGRRHPIEPTTPRGTALSGLRPDPLARGPIRPTAPPVFTPQEKSVELARFVIGEALGLAALGVREHGHAGTGAAVEDASAPLRAARRMLRR